MRLEETRSPRPSPPERGKHAQFPGLFAPFGVTLFQGDSRRLLLL